MEAVLVTLRWVRSPIRGTVSPRHPKGTPFALSYLAEMQRVSQIPPASKNALSKEGGRRRALGKALDVAATERMPAMHQLIVDSEDIQRRASAAETAGRWEDAIAIGLEVWDLTLPEDIKVPMEKAVFAELCSAIDQAAKLGMFNAATEAIEAMVDEIKHSPDVPVEVIEEKAPTKKKTK